MFADHISDHVLFIIMTCSGTVLLQLCGFALDIFSPSSTLKTSWQGGKANKKMFLCLHHLKSLFLKITDRNTKYSRTGKQGGKEMRLTNHFLKTNVMSNFEVEYFPLDGDGIIGGFDTDTLPKSLNIYPAQPDALILIWCII